MRERANEFIRKITSWLLRVGIARAVLALTAFGTVTSVFFSFIGNSLKGELFPLYDWLLPSAMSPMIISPIVGTIIMRLAYRLEETKEALHAAATTDALTGACNRRRLLDHIQNELMPNERGARPFSLLMIDVDHFKSINDAYGHATGDAALVAVAGACKARLRNTDLLCRWGGEEFLVILHDTEMPDAKIVAEDLRKAIQAIVLPDVAGPMTASIGVASASDGMAFSSLLSAVDRALYRAKDGGRNRVVTTLDMGVPAETPPEAKPAASPVTSTALAHS